MIQSFWKKLGKGGGNSWRTTSEVRDSGLECQAATAQERLRGATPPPRSGAMARRRYPIPEARDGGRGSHPASEVRSGGWKEQPHVQGVVAARRMRA